MSDTFKQNSEKLINKVGNKCTGCGACVDACAISAISFRKNSEGFFFPVIDVERCKKCNLCENICPSLNPIEGNEIIESYAAYSIRNYPGSSSGGIFSAFARHILEVDGVVYGAALIDGIRLTHIRIKDKKELKDLSGSKYIQSNCIGVYQQVRDDLKSGIKVLFSGTPCQVSALRKFLHKEYDNLFTIDLICHGVPSPGIFRDYIHYCEALRKKTVTTFLTRDNRDGWDNKFRSTLIFKDGTEEYNSMLSNLWNRIFFSELATRVSCSECQYATKKRQGDITLGDFWGIEQQCPEMYNNSGVSLLMINTPKGEILFNFISEDIRKMTAITNELDHPNLFHPTHSNPLRDGFMSDYSRRGFDYIVNKYFGYSKWLDKKIRIKAFLKDLIK